jgi:hypothetical protein
MLSSVVSRNASWELQSFWATFLQVFSGRFCRPSIGPLSVLSLIKTSTILVLGLPLQGWCVRVFVGRKCFFFFCLRFDPQLLAMPEQQSAPPRVASGRGYFRFRFVSSRTFMLIWWWVHCPARQVFRTCSQLCMDRKTRWPEAIPLASVATADCACSCPAVGMDPEVRRSRTATGDRSSCTN